MRRPSNEWEASVSGPSQPRNYVYGQKVYGASQDKPKRATQSYETKAIRSAGKQKRSRKQKIAIALKNKVAM